MRELSNSSSLAPVTTKIGEVTSEVGALLPAGDKPALERGQGDLAHVLLGRERVQDDAVGDLARDLGHPIAHRGQEHLGCAVRVRARG